MYFFSTALYLSGVNVYLQDIGGEFVGVMGIDIDISSVIQNMLQKYNVRQLIGTCILLIF